MKKTKIKNLIKQIICIIVILMLCNFIIPNYVKAVDTGDGGSLMEVITQFLCFIPDSVIGLCQNMLTSPQNIKIDEDTYSIRYSPGIIFSGEVPAFDINFITPGDTMSSDATKEDYISVSDALIINGASKVDEKISLLGGADTGSMVSQMKSEHNYNSQKEVSISDIEGAIKSYEEQTNSSFLNLDTKWNSDTQTIECAWANEQGNKIYVIVSSIEFNSEIGIGGSNNSSTGHVYLYEINTLADLNNSSGITGTTTDVVIETKEYDSSASILQTQIATWYNALRKIALIALLSITVYIGIKIVLSSTSAKEKAKYKSMLKDWLIALCLLFTLHYIMSVIITVVTQVNSVVKISSIGANGEDILMTTVRNTILNAGDWSQALAYVVIYLVLVVYTIIYTIQYFKRTIYIAFLTMIAPLITVTYPLDKIKDGKAQAFDMWIKDYIFFSLIQVVHLIIYYVFLGTTIDLMQEGNWLFAIVTIGFITPAEKLIKKMFGFEKSKTLGAMGAGATGALIMNAMQKIPHGGRTKRCKNRRKTRYRRKLKTS